MRREFMGVVGGEPRNRVSNQTRVSQTSLYILHSDLPDSLRFLSKKKRHGCNTRMSENTRSTAVRVAD